MVKYVAVVFMLFAALLFGIDARGGMPSYWILYELLSNFVDGAVIRRRISRVSLR